MPLSDSETRRLMAMLPTLASSVDEFTRQQNVLLRQLAPSIEAASQKVDETVRQMQAALSLAAPQVEALRSLEARWTQDIASASNGFVVTPYRRTFVRSTRK